ncbi:HAD family hydrolase [Thermophilibacter mediterraneus]|uniref:HAD family hydrolase n=1 Tax=Thermophilibacter mediterraneus TaxID=1871031 RepID=UPI002356913D|nr:HAD hydrolase-like protein [Thermophilibacter mediterraneus]
MALTGEDVTGRRLVIFDFDGTLADTVDGICATARTVLLAHGISEEGLGDLRRIIGPPFPQAFSLVYGFDEREAAQVTAEYRAIYQGLGIEGWPLYPGMRAALETLRAAGRSLAVASSKREALVARAVADNGVGDLFDVVLGKQSDAQASKAATIARVLELMGSEPGDAVMVGDRHHDVEAAAEVGVACVGVTYGGTAAPGELEGAGACAVAGSVEGLLRVLLGSA